MTTVIHFSGFQIFKLVVMHFHIIYQRLPASRTRSMDVGQYGKFVFQCVITLTLINFNISIPVRNSLLGFRTSIGKSLNYNYVEELGCERQCYDSYDLCCRSVLTFLRKLGCMDTKLHCMKKCADDKVLVLKKEKKRRRLKIDFRNAFIRDIRLFS